MRSTGQGRSGLCQLKIVMGTDRIHFFNGPWSCPVPSRPIQQNYFCTNVDESAVTDSFSLIYRVSVRVGPRFQPALSVRRDL